MLSEKGSQIHPTEHPRNNPQDIGSTVRFGLGNGSCKPWRLAWQICAAVIFDRSCLWSFNWHEACSFYSCYSTQLPTKAPSTKTNKNSYVHPGQHWETPRPHNNNIKHWTIFINFPFEGNTQLQTVPGNQNFGENTDTAKQSTKNCRVYVFHPKQHHSFMVAALTGDTKEHLKPRRIKTEKKNSWKMKVRHPLMYRTSAGRQVDITPEGTTDVGDVAVCQGMASWRWRKTIGEAASNHWVIYDIWTIWRMLRRKSCKSFSMTLWPETGTCSSTSANTRTESVTSTRLPHRYLMLLMSNTIYIYVSIYFIIISWWYYIYIYKYRVNDDGSTTFKSATKHLVGFSR